MDEKPIEKGVKAPLELQQPALSAPSPERRKKTGSGLGFAHTRIIHEGQVIDIGDELPKKFPAESLEHLTQNGHVKDFLPGETPPAKPAAK